jgi:hypothetical protein
MPVPGLPLSSGKASPRSCTTSPTCVSLQVSKETYDRAKETYYMRTFALPAPRRSRPRTWSPQGTGTGAHSARRGGECWTHIMGHACDAHNGTHLCDNGSTVRALMLYCKCLCVVCMLWIVVWCASYETSYGVHMKHRMKHRMVCIV